MHMSVSGKKPRCTSKITGYAYRFFCQGEPGYAPGLLVYLYGTSCLLLSRPASWCKGNVRWRARAAGSPTHISLASGAKPREHDEKNRYTK